MGTSRHRTPAGVRLWLGPDRGAQIAFWRRQEKWKSPKKFQEVRQKFLQERAAWPKTLRPCNSGALNGVGLVRRGCDRNQMILLNDKNPLIIFATGLEAQATKDFIDRLG